MEYKQACNIAYLVKLLFCIDSRLISISESLNFVPLLSLFLFPSSDLYSFIVTGLLVGKSMLVRMMDLLTMLQSEIQMKKLIDQRSLELNSKLIHRCASPCGNSSNTYFCLLYNPCLYALFEQEFVLKDPGYCILAGL